MYKVYVQGVCTRPLHIGSQRYCREVERENPEQKVCNFEISAHPMVFERCDVAR